MKTFSMAITLIPGLLLCASANTAALTSRASDLFIGFDSSVAHIATAFELPALVLWEPVLKVEIEESKQAGFSTAALSRWGYPQNRNLMLLGDRDDTIVNIIADWANNVVKSLCT